MATGDYLGIVPKWDGKLGSLEAFEERITMYVMGTKKDGRQYCAARILAQMDPDSNAYKIGKSIGMGELAKDDGATKMLAAIRAALGPKTMQEAVKYFKQLLAGTRRHHGEGMQAFTSRFQLFYKKTGAALNAAQSDIDKDNFLHPILLGVLLMDSVNLDPSEQTAVLGTSGKTAEKGERVGNSYHIGDLIDANNIAAFLQSTSCLLYTSPSPRD